MLIFGSLKDAETVLRRVEDEGGKEGRLFILILKSWARVTLEGVRRRSNGASVLTLPAAGIW